MTLKTLKSDGEHTNRARIERIKATENPSSADPGKKLKRNVVEDCEIVKATETSSCSVFGFQFATVPTRAKGWRLCLLCPRCGRKVFQLYRPSHLQTFACRACHNLAYTSVQKHDARLDRLLRLPDSELRGLVEQNKNIKWKLLAIRAAYIRLGLMDKY
jgi:formylmethanofuran dehydrogenase subunit E